MRRANARALSCSDASYDLALIFISATQHVPTRVMRQHVFAEIARVLRPGGVLILALDNLAPALTCYVWWSWKRLTAPRVSANGRAGKGKGSSADALLESRRKGTRAWLWHARGLARTLRWRTWNGAVDIARAVGGREAARGTRTLSRQV